MGSGSEVPLCVEAGEKLNAAGIKARVVSMPSWELFERQDAAYKESVLPASVSARVSVEMASTFGWERYTGPQGKLIWMRSFGASAPLKDLLKKFGMEADKVGAAAREGLGKRSGNEGRDWLGPRWISNEGRPGRFSRPPGTHCSG